MINLDVKIDSESKKVLANLEGLHKMTPKATRQCLYRIGKGLRQTASKGILNSNKTGNTYSYKGRRYRASAPGEYPKNVRGGNRRSIAFNVRGTKTLYFGAGEKHSKFLVEGTKNMQRRDFLLKAITQSRKEQLRIIRTEFAKRIRQGMK